VTAGIVVRRGRPRTAPRVELGREESDADRRISFARRSSKILPLQLLEPLALFGLQPRSLAGIDLGTADPLAHRSAVGPSISATAQIASHSDP
jgi:hypothetical protein